MDLENLKYPIGKFIIPNSFTPNDRDHFTDQLASFPSKLTGVVKSLTNEQLDTPYREGGWTIRQVVHHLADSHMNAYIRFKLAITENTPTINAYREAVWAEMDDAKNLPIAVSLFLLESLHLRWTIFIGSLSFEDFQKAYFHPEKQRNVPLSEALASYSWHCNHHLAHITSLLERNFAK